MYTDCGTACPPTCSEPYPRTCTLHCVPGCQCPSGTVLDEQQNKCVKAEECSKITSTHHYKILTSFFQFAHQFVHINTVTEVRTELDHVVGMLTYILYVWYTTVSTSHFLLYRPPPHTLPACPNQCRSTYCNACYYSETPRNSPKKCNRRLCADNKMTPVCLRRWAKCVDKKNRRKNKVQYN